MLISIVELHFNSMITHLTSIMWRRLLIMMFPMHQISMMIESTHAVGSLNWKDGRSVITIVRMSYSPTDDSYSSLRQLSVIFFIKLCFSSWFCFTPRMCSFMFAFVCLSYLSFHLYYSFLFTDAHYWISWRSKNSNFFNLETVLFISQLYYVIFAIVID